MEIIVFILKDFDKYSFWGVCNDLFYEYICDICYVFVIVLYVEYVEMDMIN